MVAAKTEANPFSTGGSMYSSTFGGAAGGSNDLSSMMDDSSHVSSGGFDTMVGEMEVDQGNNKPKPSRLAGMNPLAMFKKQTWQDKI